jgi:hypothetical protein
MERLIYGTTPTLFLIAIQSGKVKSHIFFNDEGKTALDLALEDGKMAIAQWLHQAGAVE